MWLWVGMDWLESYNLRWDLILFDVIRVEFRWFDIIKI